MDIVITIFKKKLKGEVEFPEIMTRNMECYEGKGINGEELIYIISITEKVLEVGANLAAIAGFVCMIVHDRKIGRVSAGGKEIDQNSTQEDIENELKKAIEKDGNKK